MRILAHELRQSTIFENLVIKQIILFLWDHFFWKILLLTFLPSMFYFLVYCLYVTWIFEKQLEFPDSNYEKISPIFQIGFIIVSAYLMGQEIVKSIKYKTVYLVTILTYAYFIFIFIYDFSKDDINLKRRLFSWGLLIIYVQLFIFFRLFKPTAVFLSMIGKIFMDIIVFTFILSLLILAFASIFFVMSKS